MEVNIEEFKYIAERKKYHENVSNQMLLFCMTSFGTVLGFNEKIPHESIPYILIIILTITSRSDFQHRIYQNFNAAFMSEYLLKENRNFNYETFYNNWSKRDTESRGLNKIKIAIGFVLEPFFILLLVSAFSSCYFGKSILDKNIYFSTIYFIVLVALHLYILYQQVKSLRYNYIYFMDFFKKQREIVL